MLYHLYMRGFQQQLERLAAPNALPSVDDTLPDPSLEEKPTTSAIS
jgi:hypothetical protein